MNAAAEKVAPTFNMKPAKQPEVTVKRERVPNPFLDAVKELKAVRATDEGKEAAITFDVAMENKTEKGRWTGIQRVTNWLREAGAENDCTVRVDVTEDTDEDGKKKKGTARVTFWTTKRIERKKGDKDGEDSSEN